MYEEANNKLSSNIFTYTSLLHSICKIRHLTFSWRRPLFAVICSANQWTGFYMIMAFVMKELSLVVNLELSFNNFIELVKALCNLYLKQKENFQCFGSLGITLLVTTSVFTILFIFNIEKKPPSKRPHLEYNMRQRSSLGKV